MPKLSAAVAEEVRRLMEARKVTAYALSKATGIPQSSLSRKLRRDDPAPFDLDDVKLISEALGIEPEDLIAWSRRRSDRDHPQE